MLVIGYLTVYSINKWYFGTNSQLGNYILEGHWAALCCKIWKNLFETMIEDMYVYTVMW